MSLHYNQGGVQIYLGDCRQVLTELPDASVQCVVTSPPYWALRDYDVEGQIGLEASVDDFIKETVAVFREVRRVLADDGTLWLNLGDTYVSTSGQWQGTFSSRYYGSPHNPDAKWGSSRPRVEKGETGLPSKNLIGVPWRVAFALQADGWILRQDIIWHKPNPMPESAKDRCTKAHEYLFLMVKQPRYYFDTEANSEPVSGAAHARGTGVNPKAKVPSGWDTGEGGHQALTGRYKVKQNESFSSSVASLVDRRNRRSVWSIRPEPYPSAHFATFPRRLVEPCVLVGSRPGDVILDPFVGSGTTLEVAKYLGRRAIGIELNPDYIPLIERRLMQESLPLHAPIP